MVEILKVVCLQPQIIRDEFNKTRESYQRILKNIRSSETNIDVMIFPEYWNGLRSKEKIKNNTQSSYAFLQKVAEEYDSFVIGAQGDLKEEILYNKAIVIDENGKLVADYFKRNLFGFENAREMKKGETDTYFDIKGWKSSVKICSDLWNTEHFLNLVQKEIEFLAVPIMTVVSSPNLTSYGRNSWYFLTYTRSKEGCMVIGVSDSAEGLITQNFHTSGGSCIADPSIKFLNDQTPFDTSLKVLKDGKEGYCVKVINKQDIIDYRNYRRSMGLLK